MTWFREHIDEFQFPMERLYCIAGISRQGYFSEKRRIEHTLFIRQRTLELVKELRKFHPAMGARVMFHKLKIKAMGINQFERLISSSGLGIEKKRTWIKTTNSLHPWHTYNNLTYGLKLTDINQLWVSDITYWLVPDTVFYCIFIMDVYTRFILGYTVSDNMYAINNITALKMAFRIRNIRYFYHLIHHSDKGSQYCSKEYIKLLKKANITISMANNSLENPYAERLNGIIKNSYLRYEEVTNFAEATRALATAVYQYNYQRPHSELDYLTPAEYERKIQSIPLCQRTVMTLHDFNTPMSH